MDKVILNVSDIRLLDFYREHRGAGGATELDYHSKFVLVMKSAFRYYRLILRERLAVPSCFMDTIWD
jgi:hypothetical protein